jgi:hypothetical protein
MTQQDHIDRLVYTLDRYAGSDVIREISHANHVIADREAATHEAGTCANHCPFCFAMEYLDHHIDKA